MRVASVRDREVDHSIIQSFDYFLPRAEGEGRWNFLSKCLMF